MSATGKSASPPQTSSTPFFGSLPKAGFLRRTSQKPQEALMVKTQSVESERGPEDGYSTEDDPLGVGSEGIHSLSRRHGSSKGSVDSIPLSDLSLSQVPSSSSPVSSSAGQDIGPDMSSLRLSGRRGSQFSTSSQSQGHSAPVSQHRRKSHRNSLSSIVSSTGSPLAPASSNGTTIGDLSTASMPLLADPKGNGRDDETRFPWLQGGVHASDSVSIAASTSSRRMTNSSLASVSDSSSVHSYPPVARRKRSIASSADGGDTWSLRQGGSMGRQTFDGHSPSTRISTTSATQFLNPFAPLRKRLVRNLGPGKRVGVEVQLIVELVDALENYMRTFSVRASAEERSAGSEIRTEVVNEVTSLLKELTEIAPEAQRCLFQGQYGPLASGTDTRRTSHNDKSNHMFDSGLASWWPRRLVKDCRGLLEEVGIAAGTTPRSPTTPVVGDAAAADEVETFERALGRGRQDLAPATESNAPKTSQLNTTGTKAGEPYAVKDDLASVARREELLAEGRRRWEAYLKRGEARLDT